MTYETRNQHVACWLVYGGLTLSDVATIGKSISFTFDDPNNEGDELTEQFFSDNHVTSANALLDAADHVRRTVREMFMATKRS